MLNRTARIFADWILPLAVLAAATAWLRATSTDVDVEQRFHDGTWYRADDQPWSFLYHYGVIPAWVVAVASLVFLVASRWRPSWFMLSLSPPAVALPPKILSRLSCPIVQSSHVNRPKQSPEVRAHPQGLVEGDKPC